MGHFHLKKVRSLKGVKEEAVFDTDPERLAEAEAEGMKAFDSLEKFLACPLELVVIATPNQWHAPYALACMEAGKDVLCEKPAVLSVSELDSLQECSRRTGRIFTVHQQRRWDPDYRAVCDMVKSGKIGHVTTIESRVFGERGVCFGWRADPESGGGMLYDWGVHLIDQILMLFEDAKVTSVYARVRSILTPVVDDFFDITLLLDNEVCARISVTTFALQKMPRWFVFGDRGTMKLNDFSGVVGGAARIREQVKGFDSVVGQKDLGPSRTMAPLHPDMLEALPLPEEDDMQMEFWEQLVRALNRQEEPAVTLGQIRRQLQIVEAAFLSSAEKRAVETDI